MSYHFDWDTDSKLTGGGYTGHLYGWGVSSNKRYLVFGKYTGIINSDRSKRINLFIYDSDTGERRMFGVIDFPEIGNGGYLHLPEMAVSRNGKYVVATEKNLLRFWQIDSECGVEADPDTLVNEATCRTIVHYPDYHDEMPDYSKNIYLLVNDDFTEIRYTYYKFISDNNKSVKLGIKRDTSGYIDYLAMGDSYSSGEGDVVGGESAKYRFDSHACHLSANSYPFILRSWWRPGLSSMNSVACSGARVVYDYISDPARYDGQNGDLNGHSDSERESLRQEAIANFKPGIVPQLEFVKTYKPKVVTLTGGGNDVGFADVLRMCASPDISLYGAVTAGTCSYAGIPEVKSMLRNSIRNQYNATKKLLRDIQQASPGTKIYLIGYPKFISEGTAVCSVNSGDLNSKERAMINSMVEELNDVLWRAAADTGVFFVDIEDSLEGGKMCQGSKYVTGLVDLGYTKVRRDNVQEAFHPNAKGHMQMAKSIYSKVPSFGQQPGVHARPNAVTGSEYESSPLTKLLKIASEAVERIASLRILIESTTLLPGSSIRVVLYSDPVDLGTFTVDQDGSVDVEIALPEEVTMGHHTLVVEGVSSTGDPVTLYQNITVTSGIDGDMDGDGIPDDSDKCQFITKWIDESTGKNMCSVQVDDKIVLGVSGAAQRTEPMQGQGAVGLQLTSNQGPAISIQDLPSSSSREVTQLDWLTQGSDSLDANKLDNIDDPDSLINLLLITGIIILLMCTIFYLKRRGNVRKAR